MAKQGIRHNCGHIFTYQLYGPGRQRDFAAARMRERSCADCVRKHELARAQQHEVQADWPELTGTVKQVEWAVTLRHQTIRMIRAQMEADSTPLDKQVSIPSHLSITPGETTTMQTIIDQLLQHQTARWWIDHCKDIARVDKPRHDDPSPPSRETFVAGLVRRQLGERAMTTAEKVASGDVRLMMEAL